MHTEHNHQFFFKPAICSCLHAFEIGLHAEIGDHLAIFSSERSDGFPPAVVVENIFHRGVEHRHHIEDALSHLGNMSSRGV